MRTKEGLNIMRVTGRNMAWLLKILSLGKQNCPYPEAVPRVMTNFIP
jgi:hypothetical protein